jgi:pentatricopeptide repeat protein
MQAEVVHPDAVSYVLGLKACATVGTRDKGRKLHVEIQGKGFLRNNVFIGSSLIDMYAKCGSLPEAQEVFEHLTCRNVVTWTALIAGFVLHGQGKEALRVYHEMQSDGVTPNVVTYICALKACSSIRAIEKGQEIHAHIERHGLLETDLAVGNTLIDMYAKFGLLPKARKVFDELPSRNIVSWTALIAGYTEHGYGDEALECFAEMQGKGFSPNAATFICGLRACGSTGAIGRGHEIHAEIERRGLLDAGPSLGNSLIDMYAKCGSLSKAQEVFDHLPARDIVSWNSLLAGYAEHDRGEEVLVYFDKMQDGCVSPDAVTFVCSLKACGSTGAIEKGQEIHAEVERQGLLERNPFISST